MSIFTNNITPSLPSNISWNSIGYIEWEKFLQETYQERFKNTAVAWNIDPVYVRWPQYSKNTLKHQYSNKKYLNENDKMILSHVIERIYKKYGVWLKYKVNIGKNKRIKSIYFYRFC